MPGSHIHILEAMDIAGGACDGIFDPSSGYIMRGGREMENHFECLWDLFHSIPSLEKPGASVLDEYYWLNKHDPNYSLCRWCSKCPCCFSHICPALCCGSSGQEQAFLWFFLRFFDCFFNLTG